jgi:hypothetical protein
VIQINTIKPLEKCGIEMIQDIELNYVQMINSISRKSPKQILQDSLVSKKLYGVVLKAKEIAIINYIISNYDKILLGTPNKLQSIKIKFDKSKWTKLIYGKQSTPFGNALLNAFGYKKRFRSIQSKGLWLASMLNLKVCPYCNSQYTLVVKNSDGEALAKFQFDHFFPKSKYPFLSISLYNLIPSCASCNHKKRDEDLNIKKHFHPYFNEIARFSQFRVSYPANPTKLTLRKALKMKLEDIDIDFISRYRKTAKFVEEHNRIYDVTYLYKRHKDIAHQILINSILHGRFYQKSIRKIKGLFPDNNTLMKYVLGNYLNKEEINERPLSKFTQDLAKQLRLIA